MRIVAGKHRGRRIEAPAGHDLRPTSDRVREALFNLLAHNPWGAGDAPLPRGVRVLDAFAGTGALGLEALSRGATHATFMEIGEAARRCLGRNTRALDAEEDCEVLGRDATRPGPAPAACALAFLDPPYRSGLAAPALAELARMGWLARGAVCAIELAAKEPFEPPDGFEPLDDRRYGAARIVLLRWTGGG